MRWDVWGLPCNGVRGVVRYLFRMMTSAVTRAEAAAHAARVPGMAVTTKKVRAHRCVGKTGGRRGQQGPTGRGRKARISARRVSQGRPCRGVEAPLTVVWGRVPVCGGTWASGAVQSRDCVASGEPVGESAEDVAGCVEEARPPMRRNSSRIRRVRSIRSSRSVSTASRVNPGSMSWRERHPPLPRRLRLGGDDAVGVCSLQTGGRGLHYVELGEEDVSLGGLQKHDQFLPVSTSTLQVTHDSARSAPVLSPRETTIRSKSSTHSRTITLWDHPRSRGENLQDGGRISCFWGPSPLAWGERRECPDGSGRSGTIPARVGRTTAVSVLALTTGDHPRSRGENPTRTAPMRSRLLSLLHFRGGWAADRSTA